MRRAAWRRWSVVAAAVLVLAALPAAVGALPAHAPSIRPTDLVARIRASAHHPYQGYAISSGTAGLPTLPQLGSVSRLLDGDTQLRTWYAAPDRWRVDEIDLGAERDLYQTPDGQAQWDYGANQLTAVTGSAPVRLPRGADLVPPDLGRRLLAASAGTGGGQLSALPARRVAGIAAAGVRLTPADPDTTIGRVDVWADPGTGVPLQVEITPRGAAAPILVTRFLEVSLTAPAPPVLIPPAVRPGMGFTAVDAPDIAGAFATLRLGPLPDQLAGRERTGTPLARLAGTGAYGAGFTQFVVLPVPSQTGFAAYRSATNAGGTPLALPGGEGVLISTPLLSVLVMDSDVARRNYVLAGLVQGTVLRAAAAELSTFRRRR
ncbi:MAG: hypothetical protein V7603_4577 [Micromonosporaceae bacterium]